ncbi:hypothetical protein AVEN_169180-1 [Araneus ventricosus]|uniref:Uncharacterized protein n=1 Tax=Araneus ventricosus TaxID=182803 RepID=A0A4Y2WW82_ARAVE|nr:hypothetical protein AVEN_169180-1 [Araneus ventricosus]
MFSPAWWKSHPCPLSQFLATVFALFEENLVPLGYMGDGVSPDFPLELLRQFLSFATSMDIAMHEDDTITQHARAFASDGFTMAQ